jgi:DNA polymerase I-like protein with 3'-5' exonuclease and polymerase domains
MAEFWDDLNAPIIQDSCLLDVCEPRLQVHDELIFECREDMVEEVGELAKYRFQNCAPLHVPIKAGAVSADTWGDLEK